MGQFLILKFKSLKVKVYGLVSKPKYYGDLIMGEMLESLKTQM
ncbi:hypothetical protein LEP1GSC034_2355 [Leptospira interrogans str. 2003000735]|uniref:Uncharacterized protein n=1 Tax=Leptospira interrogans serovar Hardjo str. Norma TaxID=1279460 RepID=A0A0M4N2I4_LEPIR|nr:hypothetical protein G436_0342 [Leptospira interrogans serovar Hardjo str. Norma]EKO94855.1 hypothetical protein LEP1GSC057_0344 [Leptospira interrogans str. Brem 329]EKQ47485.1 hypothetical protein LEP1GSC026_4605 [Leptospira interrogans str. 2002000623]EMJ68013.1 hypothetical protein LEP1GSC034_2355 [Leptospira interrogans str. 2003000735]EMJ76282.1 hypothetical protein LEP1GSC033_0223 [Leptospira interrogans str. 2002000632]EMJ77393.1 hypothetical protein LEP1GSC032_4518 [Leptospira inte